MKEQELIRFVRDRAASAPGVATGIGDDAAVLEGPEGETLVITTDLLVEGTHFETGARPRDVGHKALAVSLSDVAAMGCRPTAAVMAVAFREEQSDEYAKDVLLGIKAVAGRYDVPLVGGDTTRTTGPAVLVSTALGRPPEGHRPVLRSGATVGQAVAVTGRLGGSLLGRHLTFPPRVPEALELVARTLPGAMIDLSDGMSTDARHVADESGVGIRLFADRVPVSGDGDDALRHALNDGEDFELLFTVAADAAEALATTGLAGTPVAVVGAVVPGPPAVRLVMTDGTVEDLGAGGYEHFG